MRSYNASRAEESSLKSECLLESYQTKNRLLKFFALVNFSLPSPTAVLQKLP